MMRLLAWPALALFTTQALAQYAEYSLRPSYPNVQVSKPSDWASVTYPPAPQPLIPHNVYRTPPILLPSPVRLAKLDDPCSPNSPYISRALSFAMNCENWDAEQFQREHFRPGLGPPVGIDTRLFAFRLP